jgi:hypothetical protein
LIPVDHKLFKSRTDHGLYRARETVKDNPEALRGYILGLEVAAGVCRSHIVSAAEKFGERSEGVRLGRADLCCIERELRRSRSNED